VIKNLNNKIQKELERFPKFKIIKIDNMSCYGKFNCDLIYDDGDVGYLINRNKFYEGKFFDLNRNSKQGRFVPIEDSVVGKIRIGEKYFYFDSYWGERTVLVLDNNKQWHKKIFNAKDKIIFKSAGSIIVVPTGQEPPFSIRGKGKIVKNAWDHEHCAICWETISDKTEKNKSGYITISKNKQEEWICDNCYNSFVITKSLAFIDDDIIRTQIKRLKNK